MRLSASRVGKRKEPGLVRAPVLRGYVWLWCAFALGLVLAYQPPGDE